MTSPGILPTESGEQQETRARGARGPKKLDINFSTPELGLGLGISIKTLNFRDGGTSRYTKNYTRIDDEFRVEAKGYHQRHPYAVLVAVVFLPIDACEDGTQSNNLSSFAQAVRVFRPRAGRTRPKNEEEIFERVFIALYDASDLDSTLWFDVLKPPPRKGRPKSPPGMRFEDFLAHLLEQYGERNDPPFEFSE